MTSYVSYAFTTVDDPKGILGTVANGINDAGQIVGSYVDNNGKSHGFVLSNGVYTTVDVPFFAQTWVTAINNTGAIAGYYSDASGTYGFIYSGGTYTYLSDPDPNNVLDTEITGINDAGQAVGYWSSANGLTHGFQYSSFSQNGTFTPLNNPAGASEMEPGGINNAGQVSGSYHVSTGPQAGGHGFLDSGGSYVTLNEPLYPGPGFATFAQGINNAGQIVGYYNGSGTTGPHGFLYDGSNNYITIDDPLGSSLGQQAIGLNDAGDLVGVYYDSSGNQHGYLARVVGPVFTTLAHAAAGINNLGQIVGSYLDTSGVSYGYLYSGGTYKTLGSKNIVATGINDSDEIVGYSLPTPGNPGSFGFLEKGGSFSVIKDPSATGDTFAMGINNAEQIVGYYKNGSGVHGFLDSGGAYKTSRRSQRHGRYVCNWHQRLGPDRGLLLQQQRCPWLFIQRRRLYDSGRSPDHQRDVRIGHQRCGRHCRPLLRRQHARTASSTAEASIPLSTIPRPSASALHRASTMPARSSACSTRAKRTSAASSRIW